MITLFSAKDKAVEVCIQLNFMAGTIPSFDGMHRFTNHAYLQESKKCVQGKIKLKVKQVSRISFWAGL